MQLTVSNRLTFGFWENRALDYAVNNGEGVGWRCLMLMDGGDRPGKTFIFRRNPIQSDMRIIRGREFEAEKII